MVMGNLVKCFFCKSRRMASVCILLSILCARLSMSWISCVSVERCCLNPCCASCRMSCVSRCCMILLVIMCSSHGSTSQFYWRHNSSWTRSEQVIRSYQVHYNDVGNLRL